MGCALACIAYLSGKTYQDVLSITRNPEGAWTIGYYNDEIVETLEKLGLKNYVGDEISDNDKRINLNNIIVFCDRCTDLPEGHFLAKKNGKWMNPWINMPNIAPAKSGFTETLPSKPSWIIYNNHNE